MFVIQLSGLKLRSFYPQRRNDKRFLGTSVSVFALFDSIWCNKRHLRIQNSDNKHQMSKWLSSFYCPHFDVFVEYLGQFLINFHQIFTATSLYVRATFWMKKFWNCDFLQQILKKSGETTATSDIFDRCQEY